MNVFLQNLHTFFTSSSHGLAQKIVFAPGTAPMRKENSEIEEILFATDFERAYFVDPVYGVEGKDSPLGWDRESIDLRFRIQDVRKEEEDVILASSASQNASRIFPGNTADSEVASPTMRHLASLPRMTIEFMYEYKKREVVFVAGDATLPQNQPNDFTIFFSGRRMGMYPGFGLRGTPSDYLHEIVARLPVGGYLVSDRDLLDDNVYFPIPPAELGLAEVEGIRVLGKRSSLSEKIEQKKFLKSEVTRGIGLYRKIRM